MKKKIISAILFFIGVLVILFYFIEIILLTWNGAPMLNHTWVNIPMPWDFRVTEWFYGLITPESSIVLKLFVSFLWVCSIPFLVIAAIIMGIIYVLFTPVVYIAVPVFFFWLSSAVIKFIEKTGKAETHEPIEGEIINPAEGKWH